MHKSATQRVRSGLLSIVIGRPMSAIAGLVTLILLSRALTPEAYASYFALWAAVEIVVLASNGGLMHAAYRYVQAREASSDGRLTIFGPLRMLLALRLVSLPLGVGLLLLVPGAMFGPAEPSLRKALLLAFTVVAVCEGLARYCELVFESLLLQAKAQRTALLRAVLKPVGIGACLLFGPLQLEQVLVIEMAACGLAALIALVSLWRAMRRSESHARQTSNGDPVTLPRVLRFVLPAFLTQLLGLSYGPDVLKLVLNGGPDASALATFGFAFSLAAMVQRYLPVAILGGLFRPLFVAAAGREDEESVLARLVSVLSKLNWLVVALPLVALAPCASRLTALLSKGNYPDAGVVLVLLLLGTAFVAMHGVLSLYCLAREQSRAPLMATLAAAASLPLSVLLSRHYGADGLALGWGLSELLWVLACAALLHRGVGLPALSWRRLLRVPILALATGAVSMVAAALWPILTWPTTVAGPFAFLWLCRRWGIFDPEEIDWFKSVAPERLQQLFTRLIR